MPIRGSFFPPRISEPYYAITCPQTVDHLDSPFKCIETGSSSGNLKAHPLISHLELAKSTFVDDPHAGQDHLASALKALREVSAGEFQTPMTYEDWLQVIDLCISLNPSVTVFGSSAALRTLNHIHYQATQWRDR